MLTVLGSPRRTCAGLTRRETLQAGSLAMLGGFGLPQLLQADEQRMRTAARRATNGKAKSVICLFLLGGAATQDLQSHRLAERVSFGQQDLQDLRSEAAILVAAGKIEGVDFYFINTDPKGDAAGAFAGDQDQPQARLIEMLPENASCAGWFIAEHPLKMFAHDVDA